MLLIFLFLLITEEWMHVHYNIYFLITWQSGQDCQTGLSLDYVLHGFANSTLKFKLFVFATIHVNVGAGESTKVK